MQVCKYLSIQVCKSVSKYVCMYVHVYFLFYVCVYGHLYACMYFFVFVCIFVYIDIYLYRLNGQQACSLAVQPYGDTQFLFMRQACLKHLVDGWGLKLGVICPFSTLQCQYSVAKALREANMKPEKGLS